MNVTDSHGSRMFLINCQTGVIRPGYSSKLLLNQGDVVLNPDMDYCEIRLEPTVARMQLKPLFQKIYESLPAPSARVNMYSPSEVRKSVLTNVRMELAELPEVHTKYFDKWKKSPNPSFTTTLRFQQPRVKRLMDICRQKDPCV